MPIAAVPTYLGQDFLDASPGMRFGMYLKLWEGASWSKTKDKPLDAVKRLNANDKKTMQALLNRQQQAFDAIASVDASLRLDAQSVAPFTTGLGNEHPLENGFAFLNPYGLPYLPGSGVKGVLRQAAQELASGDWDEIYGKTGWSDELLPSLLSGRGAGGEGLSMLDALFGLASGDGDTSHLRGALTFWDVIPQIKGDSLAVEIMTPHQSHYYQQKAQAGSTNPHDSGQPVPISFLTVPPGSGFAFHVVCDLAHLNRRAPDLAKNNRWKELLTAAFTHAFQWLGFGAKTAVGYGAMVRDDKKEEDRRRAADAEAERRRQATEAAANEASRQEALARLDPVERSIQEFLAQRPDKNQPDISAVIGAVKQNQWSGDEKIAVARWLKNRMQATKGQWKESSQAKKPDKDREFQNTLQVKSWLEGKRG